MDNSNALADHTVSSISRKIHHAISTAQRGNLTEAENILRDILCANPADASAYLNLGVVLGSQGKRSEANDSFCRAIELAPDYAEAHFNLGNCLFFASRRKEAIASFRRALELRPDYTEALIGLCDVLIDSKSPGEAVILLRQAIWRRSTNDNDPRLRNMLGQALASLGRFEDAEACHEHVLREDPRNVVALCNLGSTYKERGRTQEALACYELALREDPQSVSARWNHSLALLQGGIYDRGFAEYESRWDRPIMPPRRFNCPRWDGQSLNGQNVLLWAEQGLGDSIQFSRYARMVKEGGGRVVMECQSPLAGVMRGCEGVDQLVVEGEPLPACDYQISLMSLPVAFKTTLETVPAKVPYITPDPDRLEKWAATLATLLTPGHLRVGIAWQGNPHHQWDQFRSTPLINFEPLAWLPKVQLISLQRGPGTEQIDAFQRLTGDKLVVPTDGRQATPDDLADSAAIIKSMDLVITVDTATAHLSGALGVRTWVMLATVADWRWMTKRLDSPWYPTMRLFRQRTLGDWLEPIKHIGAQLDREHFKECQPLAIQPVLPSRETMSIDTV